MKTVKTIRAFSLIELLVALSVLAVVVALVVPKYLTVQSQAKDTIVQQIAGELNNTYANWKASGGVINSPVATSDILSILTSSSPQAVVTTHVNGQNGRVGDAGQSANVRLGSLANIAVALPPAGSANPQQIVQSGNFAIYFDSAGERFYSGMAPGGGSGGLVYVTTANSSDPESPDFGIEFGNYKFQFPLVPNRSGVVFGQASLGVNGLVVYNTGKTLDEDGNVVWSADFYKLP